MSRPCNLTRIYSVASLLGIALVSTLLVYFYHKQATVSLLEREGESNSDITRTIANGLWPKYAGYIRKAGQLPLELLPSQPEVASLHREILRKIEGLHIVKVKIYDLNGVVVFSTQPSQIGDRKFDNGGFQLALEGNTVNEIVYRNQFSSYENEIYDRSLVSSYIPVRLSADSPVEGVFELYSDVTPVMHEIEKNSYQILFIVGGLMLLLYLFLLLIVRRAHKLIQRHELEQEFRQLERLKYLESHDELTGLYNRNGMLSVLRQASEHRPESFVALMAVKLMRFREIYDSIGHRHGNALLCMASKRVAACATGGDAICRVDSDEFVIVMQNLHSNKEIDFIADKLKNRFTEAFFVEGRKIFINIAIGVDVTTDMTQGDEQLLINANTALSVAKCSPSVSYVLFEKSLEATKQARFELEMDLGRAVSEKEFVLHYQPKVNTMDGKVVGMEALLRWDHPERGLIMPDKFIGLLEEGGSIVQVGEWLLLEACQQCREWHDEGDKGLRVAVNVSLKQLHAKNFLDSVREALSSTGLPPQSLELEITESVLVEDRELTKWLLHQLKRLGVTLSIDDFGTGYSSLSYLVNFPVDYIKIDRSFIRDMIVNQDHAVLTNAIVAMAKSLHLGVIAEGVETYEQLAYIQNMGCDEAQGFFFSKAVPPDLFIQVIGEINRKPELFPSYKVH